MTYVSLSLSLFVCRECFVFSTLCAANTTGGMEGSERWRQSVLLECSNKRNFLDGSNIVNENRFFAHNKRGVQCSSVSVFSPDEQNWAKKNINKSCMPLVKSMKYSLAIVSANKGICILILQLSVHVSRTFHVCCESVLKQLLLKSTKENTTYILGKFTLQLVLMQYLKIHPDIPVRLTPQKKICTTHLNIGCF